MPLNIHVCAIFTYVFVMSVFWMLIPKGMYNSLPLFILIFNHTVIHRCTSRRIILDQIWILCFGASNEIHSHHRVFFYHIAICLSKEGLSMGHCILVTYSKRNQWLFIRNNMLQVSRQNGYKNSAAQGKNFCMGQLNTHS